MPLGLAYLLNGLVVVPLVTHGFTRIATFQAWTQPLWVGLHILPLLALFALPATSPGVSTVGQGELDPLRVGTAAGVAFALTAQIGEQVDFLRFLPEPHDRRARRAWWLALLTGGPGWAVIGAVKMAIGAWLALLVIGSGAPPAEAHEPTAMYLLAWENLVGAEPALLLTGLFVLLPQLKINVTNAYAGLIAWSNFFARLTHSHPGRVVWLVLNVVIALMLVQFGVYGALKQTLAVFGHVATARIAAITADLVINKPLGWSPPGIEFRRGHLFDVNPVGALAMTAGCVVGLSAYGGLLGPTAAACSSFLALAMPFFLGPLVAWATRGRYYLARPADLTAPPGERPSPICRHRFDREDMVACPFHAAPICWLCRALETRCADLWLLQAPIERQFDELVLRHLPPLPRRWLRSRYVVFAAVWTSFVLVIGFVLLLAHEAVAPSLDPQGRAALARGFGLATGLLWHVVGVAAWL